MFEDAELMHEARALAARLATQPTVALAAIKQATHVAATSTLDVQLDLERDGQRALGFGDDYAEGVAAFLDKRQSNFRDGG